MQQENMIPIQEFCIHHKVEQSFISSLKDSGLIEILTVEEELCIPEDRLPDLEKIIRLYELDINIEGIETITHLLDRINKQEEKINILKNRLKRYESDEIGSDY